MQAQGRGLLRTNRPVGPPNFLEVGQQQPVEWRLMFPQHRRSGVSTVRPYTRSLVSHHPRAYETAYSDKRC